MLTDQSKMLFHCMVLSAAQQNYHQCLELYTKSLTQEVSFNK